MSITIIQLKYSNLPYKNILQWVFEHSSHWQFPLLMKHKQVTIIM